MNHYTYLIQSLDKSMNYIGVRSCQCEIQNDCYWGTSKHLPWGRKGAKKDQSHQAIKTILNTFSTRKEAIADEIRLHKLFNVNTNLMFWNKANQTTTGFDTTGQTFTFTKEHIANMIKGHTARSKDSYAKNWKHTAETKQRIADSKRGVKRPKEFGTKMSNVFKKYYADGNKHPMTGKTHKDETKQKISNTRKEKHLGTGINAARFSPWFIIYPNGIREDVYHATKRDKALFDGFTKNTYADGFSLSKGVKVIKRGKLKGYVIGNIT